LRERRLQAVPVQALGGGSSHDEGSGS
jgi:hypothetical protein